VVRKRALKTPPLLSLDTVLSETKAVVDDQSARISSLDTRLGVLLGLSGVILAALLSFTSTRCIDLGTRWLLIIAVILILASLLSATWGYWMRKYKAPPDPMALRTFYLTEEQEKTKLAIIDYLSSVYQWNQPIIEKKVKYTRISFASVLIGTIIIGVVIILNMV
jgi:glucan phosphoethanolaminetransferase (alkaline phosphatase superfamily)